MQAINSEKMSLRILTNIAFWQSPEWMARTDSIYPLDPACGDPPPLPWWQVAWRLFRRRAGYDVVHTMGVRESFGYALLCALAGTPSRQIMTEVFIDAPRPGHPGWRVKTMLYQWLAGRAVGFITNSTAEIETNARRFGVPAGRFRYVPLNATIEPARYQPALDGYLFCAGRTLRDYPTLIRVMNETEQPWRVVAGRDDLADTVLPARVMIDREIDRAAYLHKLAGARAVVLPLLATERATGQVVLLEAMALGKPVITTRTPGTLDIVRDGENGFLVDAGDAAGMVNRLNALIEDPALAERVGRSAVSTVQQAHTAAAHTRLRLQAMEALMAPLPVYA